MVPEGNVFYAQKISELETRQKYYRLVDFEKFQDIFTRVREEDFIDFKNRALEKIRTA